MKVSREACITWSRDAPAEPIEFIQARQRAREHWEAWEERWQNNERWASARAHWARYQESKPIQVQTANAEVQPKHTLFEIIDRVQEIVARAHEAAGEITAEDAAELDALNLSIEEKAEAYAAVWRMRREEAEACERMAERYAERARQKRTQAESVRRRLYEGMIVLDRRKIETPTATAYIQQSPPAVELLVHEDDVPAQYVEFRRHVRKDAIKQDLQGGAQLTFARLAIDSHLRIR